MSRCLTDDEIAAAQAGLADRKVLAHLAACGDCARRHADLARDLAAMTRALIHTADHAVVRRATPARRGVMRWLAVSGAIAATVAAIIWLDTVVWKAMTPAEPADPREITALLDQLARTPPTAGDVPDPAALIREVDAATRLDAEDCERGIVTACADDATRVEEIVDAQ